MKTIFGVSSTIPSNTRLTNGYTMYDWVMRQRCFPAFWGRSLTGDSAITPDEIEFLHDRKCKIKLIIGDLSEKTISSRDGSYDGFRIVNKAKIMGIPNNDSIAVFADIKPDWSINHNWMISFAQVLLSNGYLPGFIGNTDSSKNFNFDRQCSHYVQATTDVNQYNAIYCATAPSLSDTPTEWEPYCPSALTQADIHLWSCGTIKFGEEKVNEVYAQNKNVLGFMW